MKMTISGLFACSAMMVVTSAGAASANSGIPPLPPGQAAAADAAAGKVAVTGQVKNPGRYDVPSGSQATLAEVLVRSGGFTSAANGKAVRVTRYSPDGMARHWVIDLTILSNGEPTADQLAAANLVLVPGDLIYVPRLSEGSEPSRVEAASDDDFPYVIPFVPGETHFRSGDKIVILTVRGNRSHLEPGGTYRVTGTYTLNSADSANLGFSLTTHYNGGRWKGLKASNAAVTKGSGTFSLLCEMQAPGSFHVSFYPRRGESFGGEYFAEK